MQRHIFLLCQFTAIVKFRGCVSDNTVSTGHFDAHVSKSGSYVHKLARESPPLDQMTPHAERARLRKKHLLKFALILGLAQDGHERARPALFHLDRRGKYVERS